MQEVSALSVKIDNSLEESRQNLHRLQTGEPQQIGCYLEMISGVFQLINDNNGNGTEGQQQ
jgi:hypothetical protein